MARARSWKTVRDDAVRSGALDPEQVAEHSARMRSEVQAEHLAELRRRAGITQAEVATNLGVSQAYISMLEHGDIETVKYGMLRRWIESIGGRAFFVAEFRGYQPDGQMVVLPSPTPAVREELAFVFADSIFSPDLIERSVREIRNFELADA